MLIEKVVRVRRKEQRGVRGMFGRKEVQKSYRRMLLNIQVSLMTAMKRQGGSPSTEAYLLLGGL
jgi:hypothetical protein